MKIHGISRSSWNLRKVGFCRGRKTGALMIRENLISIMDTDITYDTAPRLRGIRLFLPNFGLPPKCTISPHNRLNIIVAKDCSIADRSVHVEKRLSAIQQSSEQIYCKNETPCDRSVGKCNDGW